jgi:hypothetical protein
MKIFNFFTIKITLFVFILSSHAFSDSSVSKAWTCKAECYHSDSTSLRLASPVITHGYLKNANAFDELKSLCSNQDLLLIHRLKNVTLATQIVNHLDVIREYEERYWSSGIRVIRHNHTVQYETSDQVIRKEFEILPATIDNACFERDLTAPMISDDGDLLQG